MQFLKYSFLLFFIYFNSNHSWGWTIKECALSNFESDIVHKAEVFGLIKHEFKIKKERCILHVSRKRVLEKKWIIDVCREPIHIKKSSNGGIDVLKRNQDCSLEKESSSFCEELDDILEIIQDDGLIFAKGERQSLSSEHGQVYCSFLLIKNYLEKGKVLDPNNPSLELFEDKKDSCVTEAVREKETFSSETKVIESDKNKEMEKTGSF